MNDWDLSAAIQTVKEDEAWEHEQEENKVKKKPKPLLTVHVAVPAEDTFQETPPVNDEKETKDKGLMEPLLREVELSSRALC